MGSRKGCVISFLSTFIVSHSLFKSPHFSPIPFIPNQVQSLSTSLASSLLRPQATLSYTTIRNKSSINTNLFANNPSYLLINSTISSPIKRSQKFCTSTKMASPVPQMTKLDPQEIPLVGLMPAKNIEIKVLPREEAEQEKIDMMIIGLYGLTKEEKKQKQEWKVSESMVPEAYRDLVLNAVENQSFEAAVGSTIKIYLPKNDKYSQLCLVGLGSPEEFDLFTIEKAATSTAKLLSSSKRVESAATVFECRHKKIEGSCSGVCPYLKAKSMTLKSILEIFIQQVLFSLQTDSRFKSNDDAKKSTLKTLIICPSAMCAKADPEESIKKAKALAEGMNLARELTNAPANYCNPVSLANYALNLANDNGLTAKVFGKEEIESMNMGSYLAVAKGSMYPPRFIHITYTPSGGDIKKRVAYVGKGVCFDSGGYNVKSAASQIELMKFDMGGAAAILGAALVLSILKPQHVEAHFIIPAGENMLDKNSYRPGDVIRASNNKTIEVGNTDAEGRLMLADALVYADKLNCDAIIDIATLTGACVVALGPQIAAVYSENEALAEKILGSAQKSGEKLWRMPLELDYKHFLDSPIADLNNISTKNKGGGSITAALFLREFVENTPWAHMDIAGPVWEQNGATATGYGVRTLANFALNEE